MISQPQRYKLVSVLEGESEADVEKLIDTSMTGSEPISVIIPTLNESANISHLLVRLDRTMVQAGIRYEAIVVDDHSSDDTVAVAEAVAVDRSLPVRVLIKQGQPGKSFSLMEGFAAARFDVLAMIDGDLQYPPEVLPEMVQQLLHSEIAVGDRRITYSQTHRLRGVMSRIFVFIYWPALWHPYRYPIGVEGLPSQSV